MTGFIICHVTGFVIGHVTYVAQSLCTACLTRYPDNFNVGLTVRSERPSPGLFHTQCFPSDPKRLIFVSSDQTTCIQSSTVQCWCAMAKSSLALLWRAESNGFCSL